jgi:hypothetical protein
MHRGVVVNIMNTKLILVKYHGPSYTRGSRVSLTDMGYDREWDNGPRQVFLSYDSIYSSASDQGKNYIRRCGGKIVASGEWYGHGVIFAVEFPFTLMRQDEL